jgi:hypothetical protein
MKRLLCLSLLSVTLLSLTADGLVAAQTFRRRASRNRQTERLEVSLAQHVINLVKATSPIGQRDPLLTEAQKLLLPKYQARLRADLQVKIGRGVDRKDKFDQLLVQIDEELTPQRQDELREQLRRGRPETQSIGWPLCVIFGCR